MCIGTSTASGRVNTIDFITLSTLGNAADFGDRSVEKNAGASSSNAIRGVFGGGYSPSGTNHIEFLTISTLGNAKDFGDTTSARGYGAGVSSPVRACFAGGGIYPSGSNVIDYVQIASTGNAIDFGDFVDSMEPSAAFGCSNGHGGLG
jgi:hypothetical protein